MPQLEVRLKLAFWRHGDAVLPGGVVDGALDDDRPAGLTVVTSDRTHLDALRDIRGASRLGHDRLVAQRRAVTAQRLDQDRLTPRPQHNHERGALLKLRTDYRLHRGVARCVDDSDGNNVLGDKAPHDGVPVHLIHCERDARASERWQHAEGVPRQEAQTVHRATAAGAPPEHPWEAPNLSVGHRDVRPAVVVWPKLH
jgi:hypothetical protein